MAVTIGAVLVHLLAGLAAGAVIGLERTFHGRPAGFRTHALVSTASSMLMLVTLYQTQWFRASDAVRVDPTRMAQGIMTGIGFLGAGVIFKEGLTVRGLTTAASIWTTAAIGILMGTGLYGAGTIATALTLGVLSVFRRIETAFPVNLYAQNTVRFARDQALSESEVRRLVGHHGFEVIGLAYHLDDRDQVLELRMSIKAMKPARWSDLADALRDHPAVRGFTLQPSSD